MPVKSITLILSLLGVIQAILLCAYLFSLRDKRANLFLTLMLLGLTLTTAKYVVDSYTIPEAWVRMLGISGNLLTGPFLWFYGKALFEKKDFSNRNYLHLIPFTFFVLFCWAIPNGADFKSYFFASLIFFHFAAYLTLCWLYLLANKEARLYSWFRNIVAGVTLIWFLYVGIFIGLIPIYILGAVIFSFLIYLFTYLLLKRHIFALEKYANTSIDQGTSRQLLKQIKELFEIKNIYLDSTISLKVVAENLSTSPREISQVINENTQMNFSEFVNNYRIAKAKLLLADAKHTQEKIESIAYDCGFGNVTSFNLAFKANTGITPSQYRNRFPID